MNNIKIAYIGGGSKAWARVFMYDLALDDSFSGEISLYDIDKEAAIRNKLIGDKINENPKCINKWKYSVAETVEECLTGATFVVISILPGTFSEMMVDVHAPNKYGILQTVGDTTGPGGVLRAMRSVPIFIDYAKEIEKYAKDAWVINFTNPMSICTKALFDTFKDIKCFGCCHEVFHTQNFLAMCIKEELGLDKRPDRKEIEADVSGINHFTWFSEAKYKNYNIFDYLPNFIKKHYKDGIYEGYAVDAFKYDSFAYGNKVKMDTFNRYGVLAAAGDRHLVEFFNNKWYLKDEEMIKDNAIMITPVSYRIDDMNKKIKDSILMAEGKKEVEIVKSDEEAIDIMKAILGLKDLKTNVNYINKGQIEEFPLGSIVETNCIFSENKVSPIKSKRLPSDVSNLILRNLLNNETLYEGIKNKDLKKIFASFVNQPLCSNLSLSDAKALFKEMVIGTRKYLDDYYNLDELDLL
ncbi:MAG: alpha-glucosidase/alpha-galactosidase [Gammaproteobacteria bacterium]|nr:alpha-glucosidase/alpha-galactosidase [Gammaproteobacteria bacterium]